MRSKRSRWMIGIGGMLMASAALLWFVDPAGAIPLESWDDIVPSATTRFKVLTEFGGAAVLDKETQLVWEKSPATTPQTWNGARFACIKTNVGGRKGWRLPSIPELASLVDPANSIPTLPTTHPFIGNFTSYPYWSAATVADQPTLAWVVSFFDGDVVNLAKNDPFLGLAWCVRGGMNADAY